MPLAATSVQIARSRYDGTQPLEATDTAFTGSAGGLAPCTSGDLDSSATLIQTSVRGIEDMGDSLFGS